MVKVNRKSALARSGLSMVAFVVLAACSAPVAAPPTRPAEMSVGQSQTGGPGGPSGELVVYTSRAESLFKPVLEEFNKAYSNIKVTMLTGNNGALAAKLLEERTNPQADVLINSDNLTMASLAAQGIFEPNDSQAVAAVPTEYRAEDGSWAALTLRPRVIMYNTNMLKPEDLPKSMMDLADPKWKGKIGAADSTNGAMMAQLVVMRNLLGEQQTEAFVKGLVANDTKFFGGHTEVRKAVGAGEFPLGLVNHYYYYLSKAEGAPVGIIYPDQDGMGLIVNSTNAGIVKGNRNPALAKLFVDFMLSPAGQKVYAEKNFEYPIVPGVELAEGVPPLSDFKQANVSLKLMWEELEPTKALAQKAGLP